MSELAKISPKTLETAQTSAVVLLDSRLMLLDHNRSWLRYIDTDAESVIGQNLYDLLPTAAETLQPLLTQALAGESSTTKNVGLTVRDNDVYWDMSVEPQRDQSGQVTAVLLVAYAITEETLLRQLLEKRVDDRTRKLEALYAIANIATDLQSLDDALHTCLEHVLSATHASAAAIHLINETAETLTLAAQIGLAPKLAQQLDAISASAGLIGWTLERDEPLVISNMPSDKRTPTALRQSDMLAYAAVPMHAKDKTLGVLSVFRGNDHTFTQADVDLLASVADQVGGLIRLFRLQHENAELLLQEERTRLAHQLHDAVTQSLYSLTLFAGAVQQFADNGELEKGLPYIARIQNTAQQALKEMRLLLHNLRPSALEHDGLVEALRQRLNAVERRANVQGQLITQTDIKLPAKIEEELYYIANEALNNSLKHASASRVAVVLAQNDRTVTMTISDDGCGFEPEKAYKSGGMGLLSLRERARKLGGMLTLESSPKNGTTILVSLPLVE